ncbi:MAG: ImmA/IrrE family metallo-endopeptidase [Phycisphaerae bacterium]|nr:ImmA/IrrE family metallo-endopeptidase [Phycisphaerae bacterium]
MAIGERLRYARERSGLTLRQVVERTDIGESSLSEYETDKREPRLSQLQALAQVYRRSVAFFLGEGEVPHEVVLWREQPEPSVAADIGAEFRKLAEQYHVLEQLCADRRPVQLTEPDAATPVSGFGKAEALARQVHAQLQLGDRPGQALLRVLEEVSGLKIFHMDFQPTGTAACTVGETFGPAILLNAGSARWRRNFDLAHELYHILTWRHFRSPTEEDGRVATPDEEKWANKFASVLLMPEGALRSAVGKVIRDGQLQFADLANIAREFDVSADALVWRMVQLSYFTADAARELLARYKSNADQWESQRERDNPPTLPERYRALALRALREGQLSIGRFAEYLGISRSRAMRIAEGEVPDDEPIAVSDS